MERGSKWLLKGAEAIGIALFAAMFATFIAGVAMRYGASRPLTWSDEICVILLLWSTFWSAAFVVRLDEHVTFDILYSAVRPRGRRLMALAAAFGAGVLLLAALPASYGYVSFIWRETTSTLRLRLDYIYACFPLFIAVVGLRLLWRGQALSRRGWERWV